MLFDSTLSALIELSQSQQNETGNCKRERICIARTFGFEGLGEMAKTQSNNVWGQRLRRETKTALACSCKRLEQGFDLLWDRKFGEGELLEAL